jgi:hypothetical protein
MTTQIIQTSRPVALRGIESFAAISAPYESGVRFLAHSAGCANELAQQLADKAKSVVTIDGRRVFPASKDRLAKHPNLRMRFFNLMQE